MTRHADLCVAPSARGYVVRVQGNGTSKHSPTLAAFVKSVFEDDGETSVAVDLLTCDYLDSTFLGCLLNLQRAGTESRFEVVVDEAARERLLAATRLDSYLNLVGKPPRSTSPFKKLESGAVSEHEFGQHVMESHRALAEVPSEFASRFKQIASQLMSELDRKKGNEKNLSETVILPTRPKND